MNTLLRAGGREDPQRVFMIHPPRPSAMTRISTDVNYRWDGTHFYKPGAALMFQVITPQLLAIPQTTAALTWPPRAFVTGRGV